MGYMIVSGNSGTRVFKKLPSFASACILVHVQLWMVVDDEYFQTQVYGFLTFLVCVLFKEVRGTFSYNKKGSIFGLPTPSGQFIIVQKNKEKYK